MFDTQSFVRDCDAIRAQSPLVHCITNYVAMEVNANALLAIGASPLMSFCAEEMEEIAAISSAVVINIGCLDRFEIEAMKIVAAAAHRLGKPWVLDPVGAGASRIRTQTSLDLIRECHPAVIRGNASEIMAVAGAQIVSRGVDSANSTADARECAILLAKNSGAVVSVSGATDFITDGTRAVTVRNGHPVMSRITAMGCTATAVTGAFAAVDPDAFKAAANAMAMMGLAGEAAAAKASGTGSVGVAFMDELSLFNASERVSGIRE